MQVIIETDELLVELERIRAEYAGDWETTHSLSDKVILRFIGDDRISSIHEELAPWDA